MNELVSKEARGGIACAMACLMLALGALPAFADPWIPQPIETVRVEGGSFIYNGQKITVNGFLIGKTEITQNQFARVMGYNPSWFVGRKTETLPVEDANWYESVEFCNRLSLRDGLQPVYTLSGRGYAQVGFGLAHVGTTHPVAAKAPNELGLYDMSGNVFEWTNDYLGGFPSGTDNPTGPATGWQRAIMGGAWCHTAFWCELGENRGFEPLDGSFRLGIRVLRALPSHVP